MELSDYLNALRRYLSTWIGLTLAGLLVGLVATLVTPKTYEATAQVFVAVSPSIPNSAQFVNSRVQSYPDVAVSAAVLTPVIADLGLDESLAQLQARVSASVPVDTSQLDVTVSGGDPEQAAVIANAVADKLTSVVEDLETPSSGNKPVRLTVSDPAAAPTSPVSPVPLNDLGLGLLVGLFLGLAAAVVRSRMDTAVHGGQDLRAAWGADESLELLVPRRGRARRSALTGCPATDLARKLELKAEQRRVRIVLLSPSPGEGSAPGAFAAAVAAELTRRGVATAVTGPEEVDRRTSSTAPGVVLTVADPLAPPQFWRSVAAHYDGAVLVVEAGRVDAAEVHEMRMLLGATGVAALFAVLTSSRRGRRGQTTPTAAAMPSATRPGSGAARPDRTPANSVR